MLLAIGEPTSGRYYGGELVAPPFRAIVEEMAEVEYYDPGRNLGKDPRKDPRKKDVS